MSDDLDTAAAVRQYLDGEQRVQARLNLGAAAGGSGDLEAELRAASARTGVPISSAREMPEVVKRRAAVGETMDAIQRFPSTLSFLASQDNARIAHDDVDVLTAVESALGATARYLTSAPDAKNTLLGDIGAGIYGASRGAAGLLAAPFGLADQGLQTLDNTAAALTGTPRRQIAGAPGPEGFLLDLAGQADRLAQRLSPPAAGLVQSGVSSGVQSLTQNLLALPTGLALGSEQIALSTMSALTGGLSYAKAREKGVAPDVAAFYGASDAVIEYATEKIPVHRLFADLKAGAPLFSTLWRQAVAEVPGEQVATLLQDLNEWAVVNPDKPFSSYLAERPSAVAQTLIATLIGVGGNVAVMRAVQNTIDTAAGIDRRAEALADLMRAAGQSKLRERDPAAFADFVHKAATLTGAPADVYIDVKAFGEALQQSGVPLEQVQAALPSIAAQLPEATALGEDLVIPVGELAAGIAGSPLEQALMQHVRTSPEALSQAEAKASADEKQLRAIAEKVFAEQDAQKEDTTSRDAVRKIVLEELNKAGRFTPDVNSAYADLTAQFFATQAARLGTTAEALLAKYPLKVTAAGTFGDSLQQAYGSAPDNLMGFAAGKPQKAFGEQRYSHVQYVEITTADGTKHVDAIAGLNAAHALERANRNWSGATVAPLTEAEAVSRDPTIADDVAQALKAGSLLQGNDTARGTFTPATNTIALLARADLSTFLHESGHFYLEVLADLASQPNAPAEVVADMNRLLDWFGIKGAEHGKGKADPVDMLKAATPGRVYTPEELVALNEAAAGPRAIGPAAKAAHKAAPSLRDLDGGKLSAIVAALRAADAAQSRLEVWRAMSLDEQRPFHEQFARGFEAYLFEGKAPSTDLAGIFARFKSWMLAVYKSIKALAVEVNPEVRGVFDRLLASQDEIRRTEQARQLAPLFGSAKAAGMTPEQFAAYQALGAEATSDAVDSLQARSLRDMRWLSNARSARLREMQKDADAKRKAIRAEVTAEIDAQPVEQARAALKKLAEADPETKAAIKAWDAQRAAELEADRAEVKAEFLAREPALKGLAKGQFLAKNRRAIENEAERRALKWERANPRPARPKNTVDLDAVAEAYGFDSGDALARALAEAPQRRDVIDAMTDQRMLERHGELADQQAVERAVDEALHNESRARFVATELAALDKAIGKPRVLMAAARQIAVDLIGRKKVGEVRVGTFTAAETRAAREAAGTKDLEVRAAAKRQQLLNHYAVRAAGAALDDVDKGLAYLKRVQASESLPADYADQIDALLERFDLRSSTTKRDIARRESLAAWLESQREMGIEPDIPEALLDTVDRRSYKELTVDEFRGLIDTVRQIEHLGRLKDKLLTAKDARAFQAVVDELVTSIDANSRGRSAETRTPNTLTGQALVRVKSFGAAHIKAATWARIFDGGKDGGPVWERLVRTANEAGDRETTMRAKATVDLAALVQPLLDQGKLGGKGTFFTTLGRSLNREARLAIALNWGNEGNRQRLLGGEGWSIQQVQPVLQSLTAAEWQFVQKVWDYFEAYRPEIAAKERRVYGREPQWVEPAPVQIMTADGQDLALRGGYYPIKYDPRASERAESHNEAEEAKALMRAAYTSATTRRSFTKTRAEEVRDRPLLYSLDGIYSGVQEVIHDLAWHEWLIDANRLVKNKAVAAAIRTTYGPEAHQQFKRWLEDIAQGEKPARDAGEAALAWVRQGVSISGLGLNVMSALMQPLGITQSIVRIGPAWVGRGVAKVIGSPFDTAGQIAGMSEFMAKRFQTRMREINEVRNAVKGQTKFRRGIDAAAYALMLRMQQVVDIPTWWGAYEKALAEGNADDRAAALADQAVIDSQGSGMVKDLAGIERGGPALKLFTAFYSFFNTTLNLGVAQTATQQNKARLAADYLLLFVIPAILGALLKDALTPGDAGDDDPEKLARKLVGAQLSYLFGLMFGVREIGTPIANVVAGEKFGQDYTGPAGLRMLGDVVKLTQQAKQGEADDGLRKAIVNVAGELLRLPSAQVNRTVTGAKALAEGKTSNPLALVLGFQEPH